MLSTLYTPTGLYVLGSALLTVLVVILTLSVYYYWKAKELAPYLARLEDLQRKIAESQNTLEETKSELKDKQDEIAKADRLIADAKHAEKFLSENRAAIETLQIDIDKQKARLVEATENFEKRHTELNELTQLLSDKNLELKSAIENKNAIEIEFSRLKEEVDSIKISISNKKEQEQILAAKIDKRIIEKNELSEQIQSLRNDLARMDSDLKTKSQKCNELETELDKTKLKLAEVKDEANAAQTVISSAKAAKEMTKERWQDLDRPYMTDAKEPAKSDIIEIEWLNALCNSFKENGFLFDNRIIKAFHTGLKCAEVSPLVVLAGISGTGKSLLPELYSAALGMNFLSVAVQPRWDSPQDMFGFYNYMEGRYKATELSRLLWQFDTYNNKKAKQIFINQLPMNLVLLDEMNLARVEYYFSDLLSKLEIRHGINPDSEGRKNAEIEIECNSSAEKEQTRRLYVALNTMFVGTMNEDETTQMLSDKVIDRSNVIRFGRPQKLATKPEKENYLKNWSAKEKITFKNWKTWCQSYSEQKLDKLKEDLLLINEILEKVQRPFGHRVNQAIEKYVSCYPGDYNDAMSDQIEMKILPKLNGLDSQLNGFEVVMSDIESMIEKYGDNELYEAFKLARSNSGDSFFKWRGVMR